MRSHLLIGASLAAVGIVICSGNARGQSARSFSTSSRSAIAGSVASEWYRPEPPPSAGDIAEAGVRLLLPDTASRPVQAVPAVARDVAISRLDNTESLPLTPEDCNALQVPFAADDLIEVEINRKRAELTNTIRNFRRNVENGSISISDPSYRATEEAIARMKKEIDYWKTLKGRLHPYLVRAIAANDRDDDFYASVWKDEVLITHHSTMDKSAGDPMKQYASISSAPPSRMVKWPVVVYLEKAPAAVYTEINVLTLGR